MALVSGGGPGWCGCGTGILPVSGECGTGILPVDFAPAGTLLEQYTYDPYGAILFAENFDIRADGCSAHAVNRIGHQGLFFERFDGDYTTPTLGGSGSGGTLTLDATAHGLYCNRNRFYHPHLGRFLTRDPNETGMPILAALAMNGEAVDILMSGFSGQTLYGDGLNLYQYEGSNPVSRRDPLGLNSFLELLQTTSLSLYIRGSIFVAAHPAAMSVCGGIVAAANLYMMATDPDFLAMTMSQPGGYGMLQADMQALLSVGGSIRGLLKQGGRALKWFVPAAGFKLFSETEAWLAQRFGGMAQQGFKTSRGLRVVDQLADRVAHEAKLGYVAWSSSILEQIRRDVAIRKEFPARVKKVWWHFFRSANTGKIGADPRVLNELTKNDIKYTIYGEQTP